MGTNLMNIFKNYDLAKFGKTASNVVSLTFRSNGKNGAKIARAVMDDGTTLLKTVTETGVVSQSITSLPKITSVAQRNEVIKDLTKNKYTQEAIAAMLNISQATVSNVLRKK